VNAIAMDAAGVLYDRFGGRADLENRILRAIGDPEARFREDALRILRAFRFVAKLGFTIEPVTFAAIRATRDLLLNISNERVLAELKYIVRSPYAEQAWGPMAAAGIPDVLRPIGAGIRFLAARGAVRLDFEEFAALCFRLGDGTVPPEWRFSNRERQSIERIMMLSDVTAADAFEPMNVYVNGLEPCLAANRVNVALDPARDQEAALRAMDAALPIRRTCDLAFKGDDILRTTNLRDARKIGGIIDELVDMVVNGRLRNEFDPLREHALGMIRKMGEHDGRN
jgi:tRNA nucleotidyltransferase (CCA-adding enzyme)